MQVKCSAKKRNRMHRVNVRCLCQSGCDCEFSCHYGWLIGCGVEGKGVPWICSTHHRIVSDEDNPCPPVLRPNPSCQHWLPFSLDSPGTLSWWSHTKHCQAQILPLLPPALPSLVWAALVLLSWLLPPSPAVCSGIGTRGIQHYYLLLSHLFAETLQWLLIWLKIIGQLL